MTDTDRIAQLEAENARLRDLVAQYQQGKVSDLYKKHG